MTAKIDNSGGLRGWRLLSLALLLVTASACAPIADNWRPGDSAKANTVAWTVSRHEVQFEPGTDRAVAGEAARLKLFLANIDLRRPLHVFVGAGAADTQLVAWRNATTHALLRWDDGRRGCLSAVASTSLRRFQPCWGRLLPGQIQDWPGYGEIPFGVTSDPFSHHHIEPSKLPQYGSRPGQSVGPQ